MRTLLIDNYDSYTFNLYHLIAGVTGVIPEVVRNDQCSWDEIAAGDFGQIVISPGPGRPDRAGDFGVCGEVVRRGEIPTLGVCLGHQGIAGAWGGVVARADRAVHGMTSPVSHVGAGLFAGIPQRFSAVRYHSLVVREPLPACIERTAWADDGTIMGLAHRDLPLWGVQFHPESVATEHGASLVGNFFELARRGSPPAAGERRGERAVAAG